MEQSFVYEGVTITLRQPTGRDFVRLEHLKSLIELWDQPAEERRFIISALQCLYLVTNVDGQLDFPVPYNGTATKTNVMAFINGLLDAPEELMREWNDAWIKVKYPTPTDPELAQRETDEKKDNTTGNRSDKS